MNLMQYDNEATYLVDVKSDPIVLKVIGRANYLNAHPVSEFLKKMMAAGHTHFAINLEECQLMDSTFLGIITGFATRLMKKNPDLRVTIYKVSERNLELLENMGLHRVFNIESKDIIINYPQESQKSNLSPLCASDMMQADLILEAHKELMRLNQANKDRFKDVVAFLKEES